MVVAQLAVHKESREALLQDGSVVPALEAVIATGLSHKARELAAAALTALSDKKLVMVAEGQEHIMLSCEFTVALPCCYSANARTSLVHHQFTIPLLWMQISGTCKLRSSS